MPLNYFKNLLSTRTATILIVCFALIGRLIQLIFYYNLRVDTAYQAIATSNFVNGHGLSLNEVFAQDLSTIVYTPLIKWPPGYSVLLAPFYIIFNHNYILAAIALNILAAFTLFFTLRAILRKLKTPLYLLNLFSLVNGFFIYHFYFIASSDGIAIAAFALAIYFSLFLFDKKEFRSNYFLPFVFFLFLAGFIKYLFIPVVFVIPAFLFIKGMRDKSRVLKRYGWISAFVLLFSIGSILLYQKTVAGSSVYLSATGRGFFPKHALSTYPFTVASFIKPETVGSLVNKTSSINSPLFEVFQLIHLIALIVLLIVAIQYLRKNKFSFTTLADHFLFLAFFLSIATYGVLLALSLTVEKEVSLEGTYLWTYVQEARYYGLPVLLIQSSMFVLYFYYGKIRSVRFLFPVLGLLLLVEFIRGVGLDANRVIKYNREEYSWQYEDRFQKYADSLIQDLRAKTPDTAIVLGSPAYYMNLRVSLYSHIPMLKDFDHLQGPQDLKTKKPVVLFMIVNAKSKTNPSFFNAADGMIGNFDSYSFYTLHVSPSTF